MVADFERDIISVRKVTSQEQGPNHRVGLVLEPGHWAQHDPFLLLAEDWFGTGTFDVHPHRGIETVTYVIEGELNHFDNRNGEGKLLPGDVQWMTAGRGVIHKEDPEPGTIVHSLQLWVNLPKAHKMTAPRYQNLRAADMPIREEAGARIRVFSGSSGDAHSETLNYVPVTMVEMTLEAGATVSQNLPASYNGFLYLLEGRGTFGKNQVTAGASNVLWLGSTRATDTSEAGMTSSASTDSARIAGNDSGFDSTITVHALEPLRVLLYAGEPLHEPVVAYGPFVMNTQDEIRQAFDDYRNGRFGE